MSRSSLNYIFKIDLEATMASFELRIGKILTIFNIFTRKLSFEYAFALMLSFCLSN